MHDVFISYSHKDVNIADAICHKFEAEGIRCWYAPRDIPPGVEWADAIMKALEETKFMILVFTDYSNTSTQVHREVDAAISYEKTIIPFKCSEAEPTGSMKYYLSTLHWLDAMNDSMDKSIRNLLSYVKSALAKDGSPVQKESISSNQAPVKPAAKPKKRGMMIGAVAAVAAVVVIAVLLLLNRDPKQTASESIQPTQGQETAKAQGTENEAGSVAEKETDTKEEAAEEPAAKETEGTKPAGGSADNVSTTAYNYDENNDSPGAEDYLYTVLTKGGHKEGILLDVYFGPENSVLKIPEIIDGLPVVEIGENCFENCDYLEEVILPETVTYLRYRAFYWCKNLSKMNFPASLTGCGDWALARTAFTTVTVPKGFDHLGKGSFYGCYNLETVVLSDKVTTILEDTFFNDSALISVTIPAKEVEIDPSAFDRGSDLTIIGVKDSYTERFAKGMGFAFEEYIE